MNELEIMNLYTEAKEDKNNKFFENINPYNAWYNAISAMIKINESIN